MKKLPLLLLLVIVGTLGTVALVLLYNLPFDGRDRAPQQPLAFSHKTHAGDNNIDCRYCHRQASVSTSAGIPDLETCRSCHLFIAKDHPDVKKLLDYYDRKEPIPWVRVYHLPDHVYFPHRMHLRAGVACNSCHGEVAGMERISRQASLKMGWCLDCHREYQASIDCWTCHI